MITKDVCAINMAKELKTVHKQTLIQTQTHSQILSLILSLTLNLTLSQILSLSLNPILNLTPSPILNLILSQILNQTQYLRQKSGKPTKLFNKSVTVPTSPKIEQQRRSIKLTEVSQ